MAWTYCGKNEFTHDLTVGVSSRVRTLSETRRFILRSNDRGITRRDKMKTAEYKNIFKNENSHFYYVAIHFLVTDLIRKYLHKKNLRILDAGCGTGLLAKRMNQFGTVSAIDVNPVAVAYSRSRGVQAQRAGIEKIPFKKGVFGLVTSVDVLYHTGVKSDKKALGEFYRVLSSGGYLVLRVPAHRWLATSHDKWVSGKRRYSKFQIETLVKTAGFEIKLISCQGMILVPFALLKRFGERVFGINNPGSGVTQLPQIFNKILTVLLILEAKIISMGLRLPTGIGIILVAKRVSDKSS